jgi:hypothetical protein
MVAAFLLAVLFFEFISVLLPEYQPMFQPDLIKIIQDYLLDYGGWVLRYLDFVHFFGSTLTDSLFIG